MPGPGLDSAVREKLFQPFLTTKSAGMGVGLSICRSTIELHGGRIWVSGDAGGGTVFHFTVSCAPAAEQRNTDAAENLSIVRGARGAQLPPAYYHRHRGGGRSGGSVAGASLY